MMFKNELIKMFNIVCSLFSQTLPSLGGKHAKRNTKGDVATSGDLKQKQKGNQQERVSLPIISNCPVCAIFP